MKALAAARRSLLLACLTLALPRGAAAQAVRTAPPRIDSIVVITHDVFDSAEAELNPGFKAANALHITTRPQVVRRELLFKVGEPYDSARVAETWRNLRQFGLFRAVAIDTFRVNGRLVVRVVTGDGWSTSLELNGRSTGGTFTWSTGATELNFLGTGNIASLGYSKGVDRNTLSAQGIVRRFLGTKAQTEAYYNDYTDGHDAGLGVGVPFRSFSQRQSVVANGAIARRRVLQFRDGALLDSLRRRTARATLSGAIATHADPRGYVRLGLSGQVKHEEYLRARTPLPVAPDTVSGAVAAFAEWRRAEFTVVTHYNGFAREEDIDLSEGASVGAWLAPAAFGYRRTGVGPFVDLRAGWPMGASFVRLGGHANGLFTAAGLDSGRVSASFTAASRILSRQATIFHVQAGAQQSLAPGAEWDLGHGFGPRSFGPHAFTGNRMVWGTLEHRVYLIDELLNVLGLGFEAFLDYGGAWYANEPARKGGNVGFGLRLGATRATGTNVGRFDLAYRFGDGVKGSRWVFSFGRSVNY